MASSSGKRLIRRGTCVARRETQPRHIGIQSARPVPVGIHAHPYLDIAKASADMILLEQSLRVLDEGVLEGRKVFANISKYVRMGASSIKALTRFIMFIGPCSSIFDYTTRAHRTPRRSRSMA
jgi:magnesium-transporting ATPase (P-type)